MPEGCRWHGGVREGGHVRREGARVRVGHAVTFAGDWCVLQGKALRHLWQVFHAVRFHEVGDACPQTAVVRIIWKI